MTFTLPLPPSANRYWRIARGRIYRSSEATAYKTEAGYLALAAGVRPLAGPVAVTITIFRARQAGDLDNFLKVALDSLSGIAYADDKQIVKITAERREDKHNPRAVVSVESAEAAK